LGQASIGFRGQDSISNVIKDILELYWNGQVWIPVLLSLFGKCGLEHKTFAVVYLEGLFHGPGKKLQAF